MNQDEVEDVIALNISCIHCGGNRVKPHKYHVYSYIHAEFDGYKILVDDDREEWNSNLSSKYRSDLEIILDLTLSYRCVSCEAFFSIAVNYDDDVTKIKYLK